MLSYLALFTAALLSATIVPGFSEAGVAAMVGTGSPILPVVAVASAGNTLGSVVNWVLGRYLLRFADRPWFPVSEQGIARAEAWFKRYGTWSLLLAWLPVLGDPLTLVAGVLRVRFGLFLILVAVGKTLRYVVLAYAAQSLTGGV